MLATYIDIKNILRFEIYLPHLISNFYWLFELGHELFGSCVLHTHKKFELILKSLQAITNRTYFNQSTSCLWCLRYSSFKINQELTYYSIKSFWITEKQKKNIFFQIKQKNFNESKIACVVIRIINTYNFTKISCKTPLNVRRKKNLRNECNIWNSNIKWTIQFKIPIEIEMKEMWKPISSISIEEIRPLLFPCLPKPGFSPFVAWITMGWDKFWWIVQKRLQMIKKFSIMLIFGQKHMTTCEWLHMNS